MIYRHKRTAKLYKVIAEGFSVERQKPSMYYVSLDNGAWFDRDKQKFFEKFEIVTMDPQLSIIPKAPHE